MENFPFKITIENPTNYKIQLDYSYHQLFDQEIRLKLKKLENNYSIPGKFFLITQNLCQVFIFNPLKAFMLKLQKKPYYYLFLPALATNDYKKTITLYPFALFNASWDFIMGEKFNDQRTKEERQKALFENLRYYIAYSIAHEIRHLEQPEEIARTDKYHQNLIRYIVIPCIGLVLLKVIFWDVTWQHDWEALATILLGAGLGIVFVLFLMGFFYNRLFRRETDANRYADSEVEKWEKRVKIDLNHT